MADPYRTTGRDLLKEIEELQESISNKDSRIRYLEHYHKEWWVVSLLVTILAFLGAGIITTWAAIYYTDSLTIVGKWAIVTASIALIISIVTTVALRYEK